MAEAFDIPVSPHIFSEQSLQIMGSIPNGAYLEHIPWYAPLYTSGLNLKEGQMEVSQQPGLGFDFDLESIQKYRIDN